MRICGVVLCVMGLLLNAGCKNNTTPDSPEVISGSPSFKTETRAVGRFHSLSFETIGTVNVTPGDVQSVSVTANENILPYVTTTVTNNTLVVGLLPGHVFKNISLSVDLTMQDIERLSNNGAGNINAVDILHPDSLTVDLSGAGNFNLTLNVDFLNSRLTGSGNISYSGRARLHTIELRGAGNILAFELGTDTTTILSLGAGRAEVNASRSLDVTISGAGSVYYKGHPSINTNITGTGGLIDAN